MRRMRAQDRNHEQTDIIEMPSLPSRIYRADVLVCGGTGCHSSNSQQVLDAL